MANVRIKDLPQYTPAPSSWLPVEVMTSPGLFTTSKAHLSTIIGSSSTSNIWNSTTRTVSSLSANWQTAYTQFMIYNYARLQTVHDTVTAKQDIWDGTTADVDTKYSQWTAGSELAIRQFTVVGPNSASWINTNTAVRPSSANWNNVYTTVRPNSAEWNNVYTYVRGASGDNGIARRYAANVGNNTDFTFNLPHNLNTLDVIVQVFANSTGTNATPSSITRLDANTVTVVFATAPSTSQYRVVIFG